MPDQVSGKDRQSYAIKLLCKIDQISNFSCAASIASPMVDRPKATSTTGAFRRAAIACQSCRLRKVKCDAQSVPSDEGCGPCQRAGQECFLDPLSDGRRSVSRKFVDKLQQRIETLEALNQGTADQPASGLNEDAIVPLTDIPVQPQDPSTPSGNTSITVALRSSDNADLDPSTRPHSSRQTPPTLALRDGQIPEKPRDQSPCFYGATSHPHVVSPGEESHPTSLDEFDTIVGIDLDPNSQHLRHHLLRSFFKYQTLWVDIVNKESFLKHQANGTDSRWYSKFLENTMLACGTRLSTSKSVRALGFKFHEWAKDEALRAMSEPTPANLQGFLLLSEYEVTQGNDRPGWMFCGVACRMLSDLGLHELVGITASAKEAAQENSLAYALMSACVVYEGVWTLYLGRPSSIPSSVMSVASSRCSEGRKSDSAWLNAWVGLCVPMAEVSRILNDQSIADSDRYTSLRKLTRNIEQWYESLPPELAYNENGLTNMDMAGYGLHTQYCKVQILLRRAFSRSPNARKRRHSQITNDTGPATLSDESNVIVYDYALRIARLVVTYREAFGMEKIPSIMLDNAVVAATAMVRHFNKTDSLGEMKQQTIWLRQLVKTMESVQPHFPVVGRMLDSLRQICGDGPLCNMFHFVHRHSTDALTHQDMVHNQPINLSVSSNALDGLFSFGSDLDSAWDCFDMNIAQGMFSAGGLHDSVLDVVPSEALISSLS
ncbi:fungal-specific transcription factor domain-containing protein [Dactylonectria estremocensis]|uniref:Fungal-specific transcription factor domain-containing protein n=1 Tax=Dactylonectria estremocensis TaxID=1079267 RepID=A0A9P9EBL7_9HYPO|nr:fungal-specific transcription factor domain-containing protein [Dactylonectria estremocensis]